MYPNWKDPVTRVGVSLAVLLLVITFVVTVTGCDIPVPADNALVHSNSGVLVDIELFIDPLTNCHYLTLHNGGITPRYDTEGNHYGCAHAVTP